jgi:alanyl-tRNA synthetase
MIASSDALPVARFIRTDTLCPIMTRLLYLEDPYLKEFRAKIVSLDGEWIGLDQTAFYPGGGGQENDLGWIGGKEVKGIRKGERILHRVPNHSFTLGESVDCLLDWERRLEMMKGHTAEHMIFAALSKSVGDMELVKISITPDKKSVMINGKVDWDIVLQAQERVNQLIEIGVPVECFWVKRDDPLLNGVRAKMDRIVGEEIRIVKIDDFDIAACAGVHVRNTGEIGNVIITKFTSARPEGDFEVEFEVGAKALKEALMLAGITLRASILMGAQPQDLLSAVGNLRKQAEVCEESLRDHIREKLDSIEPEKVGGTLIYSGVFPGARKKDLLSAANQMVRGEGKACVILSYDGGIMMVVARSPDLEFDCRQVLESALRAIGGRGGGKPDFAFGGAPSCEEHGEVLRSAMEFLKRSLYKG